MLNYKTGRNLLMGSSHGRWTDISHYGRWGHRPVEQNITVIGRIKFKDSQSSNWVMNAFPLGYLANKGSQPRNSPVTTLVKPLFIVESFKSLQMRNPPLKEASYQQHVWPSGVGCICFIRTCIFIRLKAQKILLCFFYYSVIPSFFSVLQQTNNYCFWELM